MNPAFQEALAARLLWVDVEVLAGMEGFEAQTDDAVQAAYDAVHELASNEVLMHRHYGPRAPLMFQDLPELADQYNLAHEVYTQLYYNNYHAGELALSSTWLEPAKPLDLPYSKWLVAVQARVSELKGDLFTQAEPNEREVCPWLMAWGRALDVEEAAQGVIRHYEQQKVREVETYS
ncbi:hypothetical protein H8F21_14300 [Pseudomonas sp. P66]|uniref:Uncharacterized protein n=1 Tax=Pseudomonas arcuscaelestis TaxID=2710591 RepID=A0ABS2BZ64_9PSED|nr:hypothetical protein [Pseudomonas arcuscaelestis]MBM5458735.1 hypothetical protein [Pseudomonas arcuscaelestis]